MKAFREQLLCENRLFFRDKITLFWNFLFPLVFLLIFGSLNFSGSINYTLPGILVMSIASSCLISTGIGFVLMRQTGFFRRLSLTPVPKLTILGAIIVQRYFVVLVQMVFLTLISMLLFSASWSFFSFPVLVLITFAIFTFLSMGFLAANLASNVETAQIITMIPFFIMLFLGGAFWPAEVMPPFLRGFAQFLPTGYFTSGLIQIVRIDATLFELGRNLLVMFLWGGISLVLAIRYFRWE